MDSHSYQIAEVKESRLYGWVSHLKWLKFLENSHDSSLYISGQSGTMIDTYLERLDPT